MHPTRWQTRFPRALLTYTLAPHVRLPGGLQMIASRAGARAGLNGILAFIPDGATIRITYPATYCRLTTAISDPCKQAEGCLHGSAAWPG